MLDAKLRGHKTHTSCAAVFSLSECVSQVAAHHPQLNIPCKVDARRVFCSPEVASLCPGLAGAQPASSTSRQLRGQRHDYHAFSMAWFGAVESGAPCMVCIRLMRCSLW